ATLLHRPHQADRLGGLARRIRYHRSPAAESHRRVGCQPRFGGRRPAAIPRPRPSPVVLTRVQPAPRPAPTPPYTKLDAVAWGVHWSAQSRFGHGLVRWVGVLAAVGTGVALTPEQEVF